MSLIARGIVTLLILMLVYVVAIMSGRFFRYWRAARQSRRFVRDAKAALSRGNIADAIAFARQNYKSHIAAVVAAGVSSFASAPLHLTDLEAADAAHRAMQRAQRRVHAELKRGINTLTAILSTAPFLGLLGTVFGIFNAFGPIADSRTTMLGYTTGTISEALAITAMGMLVAVPAVWCRNYLRARVEVFDTETSNAELETATYILARRELRGCCAPTTSLFEPEADEKHPWEVPFDQQRVFLFMMCSALVMVGFVFVISLYASVTYWLDYEPPRQFAAVVPQEVVSPDRRFRAIIPVYCPVEWGIDQHGHQTHGSYIAMRIIPNDQPQSWKHRGCGIGGYVLQSGNALLAQNCSSTIVMWRTNDELLVQCDGCSAKNLEQLKLDYFDRKLTVRDGHLKILKPRVTHRQRPGAFKSCE